MQCPAGPTVTWSTCSWTGDRPRAVPALEQDRHVVGRLSQGGGLDCPEPKCEGIGDRKAIFRCGFGREFVGKRQWMRFATGHALPG